MLVRAAIVALVIASTSPVAAAGSARVSLKAKRPTAKPTHRNRISLRRPPTAQSRALRQIAGAKNRGALASLEGIRVGKTYSLVNPSTGHVDDKASVVEKGVHPDTKIPYAWVRFSNGAEYHYAAERLQLVGKPFAFQRAYIRQTRNRVYVGLEKYLGISARRSKISSYRGRNSGPRKRARKGEPVLGPFLKVLNEHVEPNQLIEGFHRDGRVFLSRHFGAFDPTTTTHELIHSVSRPFIEQATSRGLTQVMEGMTEYFTYKVATPHFGAKQDASHPYHEATRFAAKVARLVGESKTKELFFSSKKGALRELGRRYDQATGLKGSFERDAAVVEAAFAP